MVYVVGILVGGVIGWSVGYLGRRFVGGRGFVSNHWIGAVVGIVVGLLYAAAVSA